jgi:alpha-tubulin suppressor-like RCC1 family protein
MPQTGFKVGHNLISYSWGFKESLSNCNEIYGYNINQPNFFTGWSINDISLSTYFLTLIKNDGTLWSIGDNNYGQLGDGTTTGRSSPVQVGTGTDWKQVGDAAAIKTDGTLWTWGQNDVGYLGLNDRTHRSSPVQVGTGTDWKQVSRVGLAIKTNGTLWTWGQNVFGQLGDGTTTDRSSPVQVGTGTDWKQVSHGGAHSAAIKTDGTLWTWGMNGSPGLEEYNGILGDGTTTSRSSPVQVGTGTDWKFINCGVFHTSAIKNDGTLWTWGYNVGQLGDGTLTHRSSPVQEVTSSTWKTVSSFFSNTYAIKTDGTLWGCGTNTYGQLVLGNTIDKSTFVQNIVGGSNWYKIVAGANLAIGFKLDNNTTKSDIGDLLIPKSFFQECGIYVWGENDYGQLGTGDQTYRFSPVQLSSLNWKKISGCNYYAMTAAIRDNGTLWTWGDNYYGGLGISNQTNRYSPVQVGTGTDWKQISVGAPNFCIALKTDGTLWSWGGNSYGQLGDSTRIHKSSPIQIGTNSNWKSVFTGQKFSAFLTVEGALYLCGKNDYGQLGISTLTDRSSPTQVGTSTGWKEVSCGYNHTVAVKTDGTLWGWGNNEFYQLGLGNTTSIRSFPIQVGTSTEWNSVSCSATHTLAIKNDGTLWTCGTNYYGVLGLGISDDMANRNTFVQVGVATDWKKIITEPGFNSSVAGIKLDNSLWVWGRNIEGQLGFSIAGTFRHSPVQLGTDTNWTSLTWLSEQSAVALKISI